MSVSNAALTPKQYAAKLGVRVAQVLGWINSSRDPLRAIDVSSNPGVGRPTWRIPRDAIVEWESKRTARAVAKPARRKRRKLAAGFTKYF